MPVCFELTSGLAALSAVISAKKHHFSCSFRSLLAFGGASVLMQMQAVASAEAVLALPGLVRAKLLHGALAAALSAALCRAFPSCVPAFAPARPVSYALRRLRRLMLAAVTVLYIFYYW